MASMFAMRWVLVALSLVLSIVLIARGDVVIGVVLGVMALVRMAMFARMQQRREQFRERRRRGGPWRNGR
jgi:hypothetical protein